jgi:anthranilate synthase component 2
MPRVRILFVENDDSFSWNVVDVLPVPRSDVRIVRGVDRAAIAGELPAAEAVVIGPGPTDPVRAGLVDLVRTISDRGLPLLGICLGHQAIGLAFGARLVRTTPTHGKRSTFELGGRLFGRGGSVEAMRYHSLALSDVLPPLTVTAVTPDGVIMAVEHEAQRIAGLQFHPDSFATPLGREIVASFFEGLT